MKVYISVDIEGITGTTSWASTMLGNIEHGPAAKQMTAEALAACEAAIEMGAAEVVIKDAHDSGRNLDLTVFPKEAKIICDWQREPESMVAGIDETFDALIFVGYHSPAGCNGNPLSHTMNRQNNYIKINDEIASEFLMHAYVAASYQVPAVFVSGDKMLCEHVKHYDSTIETLAVKDGVGGASINLSPKYACLLIKEGVKKALTNIDRCKLNLPRTFKMEICFKDHYQAHRASYYPNAKLLEDGYTVTYTTDSIKDMMIARMFIL